MCDVLGVSTAGYYAWCPRPLLRHACRDQQLRVLVHASFAASKGRYGTPPIHRDRRDDHQQRVSRKRAIRLMQADGLNLAQPAVTRAATARRRRPGPSCRAPGAAIRCCNAP